jgi:hypothetical protein
VPVYPDSEALAPGLNEQSDFISFQVLDLSVQSKLVILCHHTFV